RVWVHVERALYQTAENTLKRLSYAFTEQSAHTSIHQEMMVSQVNAQEREIDSLREILSLGSPREAHLPKDLTSEAFDGRQENPEPVSSAEMIFPQGDFKQNPEAPSQEPQAEAEGWTKEVHTRTVEKAAKTPADGTGDKKHPPNERAQQTASKKTPGKTGERAGQPVLSNEKPEFSDEAAVQKPVLSETVFGQSLKTATTGDRTPEEIPGSRKESTEREGDYFEQILNRYLSIVYHTEQEARTEIHPLNLSVRTGEEAESWENVQVMEAGTEQTGEKAFLKQAEAFPTGQILSEGGNGGEPQLLPPAAEKERGYFTDGKETGKFVYEPESRREQNGHPAQEIPARLVHPAEEESETPGMNESGKPTREQPREVLSEGKTAQPLEPADTFRQKESGKPSDKGETVLLKEVRQISQQLHTERETRSEELTSLDRTRQWIQREAAFTEKETVREADLYLAQGNPEEEETPDRSLPLESGQPVPQEPAQNPGATQIIQRTTEHILQQMETQRQSLVTQTAQALEGDARAEYVQSEPILLKTEGRPESEEEQKPLRQRDFPPPVIQGDLVNIRQNSEQVNLYYDGQNSSDGQEATEKGDEEQLIAQLQEINRRNVENYQRYQELLKVRQEEEKRQRQKEKPAAMKMREESLKALENPQLVIEEHFKKSPQEGKTLSAARQAMEDLIPEETRAVYEKVLEMQQARLTSADQGEAERNTSLNEFIYDISQTGWEKESQTSEPPENQREILQATDRVIEQRREYENVSVPTDNREWTESRNLSLIHKSQENRLDEEELMELLTQNSLLQRNTNVTNRVEERNREENIVVRQQNNSTRYEEKEDMETLIQRGVQRQMGVLSDQIYSRLERRLANEKKRRGY
ncbi:MAG: hypothetical protein LUH19_01280, partial [Lachnospiraceae bacterium]|nr:hypothetical protein [Lachnospiraceae bacterium]